MAKKKLNVNENKMSTSVLSFFLLCVAAYSYYSNSITSKRINSLERSIAKAQNDATWGGNGSGYKPRNSTPSIQVVTEDIDSAKQFKKLTSIAPKDLLIEFNAPFCAIDKSQLQVLVFSSKNVRYYNVSISENQSEYKNTKWDFNDTQATGKYKREGMSFFLSLSFNDGNNMYIPGKTIGFKSKEKLITSIDVLGEVYSRSACQPFPLDI